MWNKWHSSGAGNTKWPALASLTYRSCTCGCRAVGPVVGLWGQLIRGPLWTCPSAHSWSRWLLVDMVLSSACMFPGSSAQLPQTTGGAWTEKTSPLAPFPCMTATCWPNNLAHWEKSPGKQQVCQMHGSRDPIASELAGGSEVEPLGARIRHLPPSGPAAPVQLPGSLRSHLPSCQCQLEEYPPSTLGPPLVLLQSPSRHPVSLSRHGSPAWTVCWWCLASQSFWLGVQLTLFPEVA